MNEADRQPGEYAEPHVGCERGRGADEALAKIQLGDQLGVELTAIEHERPADDVVGIRVRSANRCDHERDRPPHRATVARYFVALIGCAACHYDVGQADNAFYTWDERPVHCAIDIDTYARISNASIETGLDRAAQDGSVLELYNHDPGKSIEWSQVEAVLAGAQQRGLAFVTYGDLARGITPTAGLAYSFDDAYIADWFSGRDLFQRYNARLTFFIAFYDKLSDADKASLAQLAADGHDIEAHSVTHQRGPDYVEARGLGAYISEEVAPSITRLQDDGYDITTYAYPYGARTDETDRAIRDHVQLLRSVTYTWDSPAVDPCPL